MKKNLFLKELKENRWILIIGLLFTIASGVIIVYSYNFVELLDIERLSEQLEGDLGILGGLINDFILVYEDHTTYIWSQWHGSNLVQISVILSIVLGMGVIAKETSKGTISFLVSKPVSRFEIFTTKVVTGVSILYGIIITTTLLIVYLAMLTGLEIYETRLIIGTIPSLVGFLPVYFTAVYFSNKFDESLKAGLFTGLVWGGISVFGFFERTEFLSPFYHIRASDYFAGEGFPYGSMFLLALASLLIFYLGFKSFKRREF